MSGREGGPGAGASSLKLISNKTQPPESHPSEGEGACDIPGAAPCRSGKTQSRPEAVCPAAPCPKGPPGGTDSGLVWAKPSFQAWLWRQLSLYFSPGGSIGLSPHLSLRQTSARPARTPDAAWGWGWGQLDSPTSGRSLKINNNNDNNDNSNN